jgi:hypothetical protein
MLVTIMQLKYINIIKMYLLIFNIPLIYHYSVSIILLSVVHQSLVKQGFLIIEPLLLHSDTSQSVGLLWTSAQSDAETSTWQHTTLPTDGPHFASRRAASDPTTALHRMATRVGTNSIIIYCTIRFLHFILCMWIIHLFISIRLEITPTLTGTTH